MNKFEIHKDNSGSLWLYSQGRIVPIMEKTDAVMVANYLGVYMLCGALMIVGMLTMAYD
jgi:hypothetical protein